MKVLSLRDSQKVILDIYGIPDDQLYEVEDFLYYGKKFLLEYSKFYQEKNIDFAKENLTISLAWFLALMNRYHLDIEEITWRRYSYKCPFCASLPCFCEKKEGIPSKKTGRPASHKPATLSQWQKMIAKIYREESPKELNLLLMRRMDDLHYSLRKFLREKEKKYFKQIELNSADYFVIFLRVFNSINGDLGEEFKELFENGCHVCHKIPCECNYS